MYRLIVVTIVSAGIIFSSCNLKDQESAPNINYGRELCAECRMIISDPQFTAAFLGRDGEIFKFDDIGCMKLYEIKNHPDEKKVWVRNYESQKWVELSNATFVFSKTLETPMGHGIAAFATKERALDFLKDKDGKIVSWEEMENVI